MIKTLTITNIKIKAVEKLLKTAMDVLYIIMILNDENVVKEFQPSIFYISQENHVFPKRIRRTL